jgi:hypothetical protein
MSNEIFVSQDPRIHPVNALAETSVLYRELWFRKLDNGSSTNVDLIETSGASGFSGNSGISGYSGVSGASGISAYSGS